MRRAYIGKVKQIAHVLVLIQLQPGYIATRAESHGSHKLSSVDEHRVRWRCPMAAIEAQMTNTNNAITSEIELNVNSLCSTGTIAAESITSRVEQRKTVSRKTGYDKVNIHGSLYFTIVYR